VAFNVSKGIDMTELGNFEIALTGKEISFSASVTPRHRALLTTYRMNAHRGQDSVRILLIRDLRSFLDLGALERATDLLIVLALFMRETARCERRLLCPAPRRHDAIALQPRYVARGNYAVGKAKREPGPALRPVEQASTPAEDDETV
jgi:hypothetical protein